MEGTQNRSLKKLGFVHILRESVKIPCKDPNFIIFTLLTSLPLFFSLFMYEGLYAHTIIKAAQILHHDYKLKCIFCYEFETLEVVEKLIGQVSHNFVLLLILHLGIFHFLELLNTIATVNSASSIYAGDKGLNLKDMFIKHLCDSRFKGPLITSIYGLLLSLLLSMGLLSLSLYMYMTASYVMFVILFLFLFVALLTKYLEWSTVWEMGTLISVLEEKEGDVALVVSAYFSRGNRTFGIQLMFFLLVWRFSLRFLGFFFGWNGGGAKILVTVLYIALLCLGNVFKWVAFLVYYNECRKGRSDKEVSASGEGEGEGEGEGISV